MSMVLVAVAAALSLLLATFAADIAEASATKARAQVAADAAALAAAAESSAFGTGLHREVAGRFAKANGATLIECLCEPGATAVQVRVSIDGVVADARAVFDPTQVMPLQMTFDGSGLHPVLAAAVDRLVTASHGRVHVVSGRRSSAKQAILWADALARYGSAELADDWVARPGTSMHEKGLAVDLGGDLGVAAAIVEELGLPLVRPMPHEPWHFELAG